jgi:hypothetical protein
MYAVTQELHDLCYTWFPNTEHFSYKLTQCMKWFPHNLNILPRSSAQFYPIHGTDILLAQP